MVKKNYNRDPSTAKPRREKGKINQYGGTLAYRLPIMRLEWQCSKCGTVMPVADKPVRCSNRETCGRLLYDKPEEAD